MRLADAFSHGTEQLNSIDQELHTFLTGIDADALKDQLKTLLVEQLRSTFNDDTKMIARQVKIKTIYLLNRMSEILQDLNAAGDIKDASACMSWIDKAHDYAVKFVRLAEKKTASPIIEEFDVGVRTVSLLDHHSPEEREARAKDAQSAFQNFIKNKGN